MIAMERTMQECEDCEDECEERKKCHHCGLLVCDWCWDHVHQCWPNHTREDCLDA